MNVAAMSLEQLRQRGIAVLAKELGPVGLVRFLQQYESGAGDYSAERHAWLPEDVPAIVSAIRERAQK
jgi:hypothetical protein